MGATSALTAFWYWKECCLFQEHYLILGQLQQSKRQRGDNRVNLVFAVFGHCRFISFQDMFGKSFTHSSKKGIDMVNRDLGLVLYLIILSFPIL